MTNVSITPVGNTPIERLVNAMRAEGGYPMSLIDRALGQGVRVRMWVPTIGGAERIARSTGWQTHTMNDYENGDKVVGAQVTVNIPKAAVLASPEGAQRALLP